MFTVNRQENIVVNANLYFVLQHETAVEEEWWMNKNLFSSRGPFMFIPAHLIPDPAVRIQTPQHYACTVWFVLSYTESHHHSSRQETHNECASLRNLKLSLTVLGFSTQAKNKSKQHQATVGRILVRWGASRYQPNRWVDPSLVQGHIGIYISLVFYIVMHTILTDQVLSLVIRMAPLIEH